MYLASEDPTEPPAVFTELDIFREFEGRREHWMDEVEDGVRFSVVYFSRPGLAQARHAHSPLPAGETFCESLASAVVQVAAVMVEEETGPASWR